MRIESEAQTISDELGLHVAVAICELWGGKSLRIPPKPSHTHPLAHDLGYEVMVELCARFGGQTLHLPRLEDARLARRRRHAILMEEHGASRRLIAEILQITQRDLAELLEPRQP